MAFHNEDRELQIRLAELQMDTQIYLATCFGLLAILGGLLIGYAQIRLNLPSELTWTRPLYEVAMVGAGMLIIYLARLFSNRINKARKQISELRKRHIW
jgi:hypothetical protein